LVLQGGTKGKNCFVVDMVTMDDAIHIRIGSLLGDSIFFCFRQTATNKTSADDDECRFFVGFLFLN